MQTFEDILVQVGGYGRYQKLLTWSYLVPVSCILSWVTLDGIFVLSVPEHWCYVETVAKSNLSIANQRKLLSPPGDPSCSMYDVSYQEYLSTNYTEVPAGTNTIACTSGWQYSKENYDSTASTKWNLVCNLQYFRSLILTLQNVGGLVMAPVYGFLADRFGRKRTFLLVGLLPFICGIASVLVEDLKVFMVLRIIYGSVMPAMFSLALILIVEIVDPSHRVRVSGILIIAWTLGLSLLTLVGYLFRSWIVLVLTCSLGFACNLIYYWIIPESPSWLVSRERYKEAASVMEQIGKWNENPQDRDVLLNQLMVLGARKKEEKVSPYSIFMYSRIRKYFLIIMCCRIAFYFTHFGPVFNLSNLSGNEFLNFFLLAVVETPGAALFWFLMNRVGRRWTGAIGNLAVGVACFCVLFGSKYGDLVVSMVGKLISTGLLLVSEQQSTELFPTSGRSFALNLGKTIGHLVTVPIPFFADLGSQDKKLPFIMMGCTSIIAGILASFLPETLDHNLPQTIEDAEQFGKNQTCLPFVKKKKSGYDIDSSRAD